MRVLITGGCGFLGSNLAVDLLRRGCEVIVVDTLRRKGSETNLAWLQSQASSGCLRHYARPVQDRDAMADIFRGHGPFAWIAHFAGQVAMTTSMSDPWLDFDTNAHGTISMLEVTRALSPHALFTFSSTNKVYGDMRSVRIEETDSRFVAPDYPSGFDETLPLDFASPYGCSKGAADQYVRDWFRNFGMPTVVFRHSSIYGGRQFSTVDQGWVGWFCERALEQQACLRTGRPASPFTISGTGKQVRDVLHADDLVRLYLSAYEHRDAIAGNIFNVGGGMENSLSLLELFSLLSDTLRLPEGLAFDHGPRRHSDQDVFVADNTKLANVLGFRPSISAAQGISAMLEWIRASSTSPAVRG